MMKHIVIRKLLYKFIPKLAGLLLLVVMLFEASIAYGQFISEIIDYRPAPGQLVNTNTSGSFMAARTLVGGTDGMLTMGAYGGFVVFRFANPVENDPDNPYGIDFIILGNAQSDWAEAGIVMVMKDENGNGLPDDTWYELAGSDHYFSTTITNYTLTYSNPDQPQAADVPWTDNQGESDYVLANSFHAQPYYPKADLFPDINQNSYTVSGTLIKGAVDKSKPGVVKSYHRGFGYADNLPRGRAPYTVPDNPYTTAIEGCGGDAMDIHWAVDQSGNPVDLDEIHFVKVYCAVNADGGWLGEVSTEITGAVDVSADATITGTTKMIVIEDFPKQTTVGQYQLVAHAFNHGRPMSETIDWSMDNDQIANISTTGLLSVTGSCTLTLTALLQNDPAISASLTCEIIKPETIEVMLDYTEIRVNDKAGLDYRVVTKDGQEIENVEVNWESADSDILQVVQEDGKYLMKGISSGQTSLTVQAVNIEDLNHTISIDVLPEATTKIVSITLQDEYGTIIPRQEVAVKNFNLMPFVDNPAGDYGIGSVGAVTAAHAVARFFDNEDFASDLRFRDDIRGDNKLYLWKVPKGTTDNVSYVYGYGGATDPTAFAKAWVVKVNQQSVLNNLHTVPVNNGDDIVIYHVPDIQEDWTVSLFKADRMQVDPGEPVQFSLVAQTCRMESNRQLSILSSSGIEGQSLISNMENLTAQTDEVGLAQVSFSQAGLHTIVAGSLRLSLQVGTVSVAEHTGDNQLVVYPNPTQGHFTINCPNNSTQARIYDLNGHCLWQGENPDGKLIINHLYPGLYILIVNTTNGSYREKISVQ